MLLRTLILALTGTFLWANDPTPTESLVQEQPVDIVTDYLNRIEALSLEERWDEIVTQGTAALKVAQQANRHHEAAQICIELASTLFYQGKYSDALEYARTCHQTAEQIEEPSLLIRALYHESAIYRAFAGQEGAGSPLFSEALHFAHQAAETFEKTGLDDLLLKGRILFNWGAAHADNLKGNLEQAIEHYTHAIQCFENVDALEDVIRTKIRLAKAYLLQQKSDVSQKIIEEIREQPVSQRVSMHIDYLEAQVKLALCDRSGAEQLARNGLEKAIALGASKDQTRFNTLINEIIKQK